MTEKKDLTVLIVDDEPDLLELIEDEFKMAGYKTLSAKSGNEAIKVLNKHTVDFIVSDYKMPDGNGLNVLNFSKTLPVKPVFFFVSGQADMSTESMIEQGARKFFSKPFDLDELIKEIEKEMGII